MRASAGRYLRQLGALPAVILGAVLLWLISGVGFANYDTLYALAWGGQLSRGQLPSYGVAIAPTPHPLIELVGLVLYPLGARATENVTVALAFLALSACGWVVYRLGSLWFGRPAGVLAALVLLTRVPIISYGVRAYVDVPFLFLVLSAVLIECRRRTDEERPAGVPVLGLLALAGLLRPEAWVFAAVYWLYLLASRTRSPRALVGLALLGASAPLAWILSDLAITGDALWSLSNTRHTATALDRVKGIGNVPQYIPRRIGEILQPAGLLGAALGGILSLLWLRRRALPGALVGVLAAAVFAAFAAGGLPINTRYAFLAAAILCIFCGAGAFGWTSLSSDGRRRRWWAAGGALVLVALIAYAPSQYRSVHRELNKLAEQQRIQDDLVALVKDRAITLRCGPVAVPNHAPIPLLALYLRTTPANIVNAQLGQARTGEYVDPASKQVEENYVLDPHDPHRVVAVPPGFTEVRANRSWRIYQRCA